jgi:hypothetical protein
MKTFMSYVVLVFASGIASASGTWTSGIQQVTNVIWTPDYHGFYTSAATFHNPEGCAIQHTNLYQLDPTLDDKTIDRLYAQLLLALTTEKTVFIWVDGCLSGTPKVKGLQINQ